MTNNPIDWTKIIFGGGSIVTLLGGFGAFIFKKYDEVLKEKYQNLLMEKESLDKELEQAKKEERETREKFIDLKILLENIKETKSLNSEDEKRIKSILYSLRNIISSKQEEFEDYKKAAKWLQFRQKDWVKKSASEAIEKHKHQKLFPWGSRFQFEKDIEKCLEWVYKSLYVYGHPDSPLNEFISQPKIKSPIPYITAIHHLKNNKDRGYLNLEQSQYLEDMLDELIGRIDNDFK